MRHRGQIGADNLARDIAPEYAVELALMITEVVSLDQLAQGDHGSDLVRHLDADSRLARDRRLDTHAVGGEVEGNIVGEVGDLADLHAGGGLQLIAGDRRTAADVDNARVHAEAAFRYRR